MKSLPNVLFVTRYSIQTQGVDEGVGVGVFVGVGDGTKQGPPVKI